jgi:hypothetical protein
MEQMPTGNSFPLTTTTVNGKRKADDGPPAETNHTGDHKDSFVYEQNGVLVFSKLGCIEGMAWRGHRMVVTTTGPDGEVKDHVIPTCNSFKIRLEAGARQSAVTEDGSLQLC